MEARKKKKPSSQHPLFANEEEEEEKEEEGYNPREEVPRSKEESRGLIYPFLPSFTITFRSQHNEPSVHSCEGCTHLVPLGLDPTVRSRRNGYRLVAAFFLSFSRFTLLVRDLRERAGRFVIHRGRGGVLGVWVGLGIRGGERGECE